MAESPKLTPLQRRFCEKVALGMKPRRALELLKWKGTSHKDKAYKLMQLAHVRDHIQKLEDDALRTAGVTKAQIVKRLADIGMSDIRQLYDEKGDLLPINKLTYAAAAQLGGVEVEEFIKDEGDAITRVTKVKRISPVEALKELAAIAGLKPRESSGGTLSVFNIQINL